MGNTADVTGGKPSAVFWSSISGVSDVIPLVAFYDIHGRKGEVPFFFLSRYHTKSNKNDLLILFVTFIYMSYSSYKPYKC
jgi:hypothetical protein